MTPQQANELLPQALTAMRDLDAISMALGARLAQIDTRSVGGHDYLLRDAVMREVMEWRRAWDKNSADRPDFAAWNRRAPAPTEPAVDRDALVDAARELVNYLDANPPMGESLWSVRKLRAALATPASPAVPEQPVAWFEADPSAKGLPLREVIGGMVHSTRFHSTKPEVLNNALWPLYENPAPQVAQASQPTSAEGKDSERLDWLEKSSRTFCGNYTGSGFRMIGSDIWHGTLREAIDGAAMCDMGSVGTGKDTDKEATK